MVPARQAGENAERNPMARNDDRNAEPSFEQALERLQEIVRLIEEGDLDLDRSLALFEEGMALVARLEQRLARAEARIEELLRIADGSTRVVPLVVDENAEDEP